MRVNRLISIAAFIATSTLSFPAVAVRETSPNAAKRARPITLDTVIATVPLREGQAPLRVTLRQAMKALKVPGFSMAVVDDYAVAWAKGYGVTASGGHNAVSQTTLYQAASVSKIVTSAGALWLVEQKNLSLDEDVNKRLTSWKVPENQFTVSQKVTLRRLMSHNAGITVHGFEGYARDAALPTLKQILDGGPPANSAPIRVDTIPGTQVRYSGGGVTIERQWIMDVSGRPFADFMRDTVLAKVGMLDSTFAQPLNAGLNNRAAIGTRVDGKPVEGGWHVYPEEAADGLWTTPTDLARFGIEIALSKHGHANHVLSEAMTKQMLSKQSQGQDGTYGLGVALPGIPGSDIFMHNGANEGFRTQLFMLADSGRGIITMGNSDAFAPLISLITETVANNGRWNVPNSNHDTFGYLLLVYELRGASSVLDAYQSMRASGFAGWNRASSTLNMLGYRALSAGKTGDAIRIFALNAEEYPDDANAFDSLGEAYARAGQKKLAEENYKRSLALDPGNTNAQAELKGLVQPAAYERP